MPTLTLTDRQLADLYRLTLTGDGDLDYPCATTRVLARRELRQLILAATAKPCLGCEAPSKQGQCVGCRYPDGCEHGNPACRTCAVQYLPEGGAS
jgi:hypothetical protein